MSGVAEPSFQAWKGERLSEPAGHGPRRLQARPVLLGRVRPVRWLWSRRLPLGYLSLLLGAEGIGKGTLLAWLVARVTRGQLNGEFTGRPGRVLVVGDEDSFDSVFVPRAFAAGAELENIETLEDAIDLRSDQEALRDLIREGAFNLVVFDALLDTLAVDVDDWRAKPVRDAIRPARAIARDLDICVIGSLHPNKGARASFRDLVSGSFAFNASSRSSLLLAPDPDDEDRRVLVRGKGNLSAAPPSFEFEIEGRDLEINGHGFSLPVVANEHDGELRVEDVLRPDRPAPVRDTLAEQIDALGTGDVQTRAGLARAHDRDPSDGSVGRALHQLEDENRWEKVERGKWRRLTAHCHPPIGGNGKAGEMR
jgi:hypothetical protein